MTKQTNATVVLHGTKEYKKLDKDLKGLLERAWAKSDEKEVNISYADEKHDFITVVKETAKSARDWREFGGTYYKRYAKTATSITFDIDNKNVDDIVEGVRLAEYNFWCLCYLRQQSRERWFVREVVQPLCGDG